MKKIKTDSVLKFLKKIYPLSIFAFIFFLNIFYEQNLELSQRVSHLEEVVGQNRLLCNEKESVAMAKNAVVRIVGSGVEGTGFLIEKDLMVTNHHVVKYSSHPKIILPDYSIFSGQVLVADKESDLAIIKVDLKDKELPILKFGNVDTLETLDELVSVGYALGTDIKGEATVSKGEFTSIRHSDIYDMDFVQTNITVTPGMSGGPMVDACGRVMAINTLSLEGLSMSLSGPDFRDRKFYDMFDSKEPLKDVKQIEFNPNNSPKECVEAFYNYQTTGQLEKAYQLLSDKYTSWTFDQWKEGYKDTLYIVFIKAEEKEDEENTVFVKFYSADLKNEELDYRYFEGTQKVEEIDGRLKLVESDIKEIEDPDWEWYYNIED